MREGRDLDLPRASVQPKIESQRDLSYYASSSYFANTR